MGECIIINRPKIITKIVLPEYSYTGDNLLIDDGNGNWRLKFLTSGTLVFNKIRSNLIDVFLVGGGGSGGGQGFGGGGGYTTTTTVNVTIGTNYQIIIGDGGAGVSGKPTFKGNDGEASSAFGITANGGQGGKSWSQQGSGIGSNGGSGGGASGGKNAFPEADGGTGGTNGSDGGSSKYWSGGSGQGTTTREFGESSGEIYAGGGGGWGSIVGLGGNGGGGAGNGTSGDNNTGGGGGAAPSNKTTGAGGSGIVIIRNARG